MNIEQILAILIFVVMFVTIVSGKVHRFIPALVGAAFTCVLVLFLVQSGTEKLWHILRPYDFVHASWWYGTHEAVQGLSAGSGIEIGGVNWQTIVFIAGMMTLVEGLAAVGFFRWLCLVVAKVVNYRIVPLLVTFTLLSGFLAMFIDSITVLLFLAAVTIELARLLKFDPVPAIIAEIFAANVGGSATMSGDPPNIVIGTSLGLTFMDFLTNTGPIAWVGMLVTLGLFYLIFRKVFSRPTWGDPASSGDRYPEPNEAITNRSLFKINSAIFILVVVLLLTHAETGLSVALIGVIAASLTLLASRKRMYHIMKGVDWRTLLFFLGLFITVGGLEATGVLAKLAQYIGEASRGSTFIVISFILWISAFSSAIVDNIPFAATMVPVIRNLAATSGFNLHTMAWTLALGTDIGGNATPIGASANVVGTAIAEEEGYRVSWGRYCKYAIPATLLVLGLCYLYLVLRYG